MTPAHFHLLLNHVPVLGVIFGALLLLYALARKNKEIMQICLVVFLLAAIVAIPVYVSGEPAEEIVEDQPGVVESIIEEHEDAAKYALIGIELLGVLSLVGLLAFRKKEIPTAFNMTTLLFSAIVIALMVWTAGLGGQINHPELQNDVELNNPLESGD